MKIYAYLVFKGVYFSSHLNFFFLLIIFLLLSVLVQSVFSIASLFIFGSIMIITVMSISRVIIFFNKEKVLLLRYF